MTSSPEKKTLNKSERICGTKRIELLFASGQSFISYPLRIVYMKREVDDASCISMMASVPKKKLKRAVKRNRIKRLIKEAFRLNKTAYTELCEQYNTGLDIVFIYLKDELSDFQEIEKAILKTVRILDSKLNDKPTE